VKLAIALTLAGLVLALCSILAPTQSGLHLALIALSFGCLAGAHLRLWTCENPRQRRRLRTRR